MYIVRLNVLFIKKINIFSCSHPTQDKPEFQDIKNDQKKVKYAYLNNSVELNCHATGNPLPDIIWHHNGKKASHNHVRTINGVSSLVVSIFSAPTQITIF